MTAYLCPDDDELHLLAILLDASGIDLCEFAFYDPESADGCYRLWDFQWTLYSVEHPLQAERAARAVGKTRGVVIRSAAFPFCFSGQKMLLAAPQKVHLQPLYNAVQAQFMSTRLLLEMLPKTQTRGVRKDPSWEMRCRNGSEIVSRIEGDNGLGFKSQHVIRIELDEGQDLSSGGYVELTPTLNRHLPNYGWRVHGVPRGLRDKYYEITEGLQADGELTWYVHKPMAMHRPSWNPTERAENIRQFGGSRQSIDYRRNLYGEHGDSSSPVFVTAKLLNCHPAGTPVWTLAGDDVRLIPIEDVGVGYDVVTALGRGRVTNTITTQRQDILKVVVDGSDYFCTPEHPFLTAAGWRHASDLHSGDRIITAEGVRYLWQGVGGAGAEEVLLPEVWPGGRGPTEAGTSLSDLRDSSDAAESAKILFAPVLRTVQEAGSGDATPGSQVQELRGHPSGSGAAVVLQSGMLARVVSWNDLSPMSGVHGGDPHPTADHLQSRVRGHSSANEESSARDGVPFLREQNSGRQGLISILQSGVLERIAQASEGPKALPAMWRHLYGDPRTQILLKDLLIEVGWDLLLPLGWSESDIETLRTLWDRVLSAGQENQILLQSVRSPSSASKASTSDHSLRELQGNLQAEVGAEPFLQPGMLVRGEADFGGDCMCLLRGDVSAEDEQTAFLHVGLLLRGSENSSAVPAGHARESCGSRRTPAAPILALAGAASARSGVASPVLDEPVGRAGPGGHLACGGYRVSSAATGSGGRWRNSCESNEHGVRCGSRPMAGFARVDSVEVLQSGSPEFNRLSGGTDSVTVYDLTVAGHPSFAIGDRGLMVHNCTDSDETSFYNSEVYKKIQIIVEELPKDLMERQSFLNAMIEVPESHHRGWSQKYEDKEAGTRKEVGTPKGYDSYWAGMDVGMTNHPSEIMVCGQRPGSIHLDLLLRVNLQRVNVEDQMYVVDLLFDIYGDKLSAFGIDSTGMGKPLWQILGARSYGTRVFGYDFGSNVIVGYTPDPEGHKEMKDRVIKRNFIEASTDWLRNNFVHAEKMRLPFDREVLLEMQAQTYMSGPRTSTNPYGTKRYSGGSFHTLDALKTIMGAMYVPPLEAMLEEPREVHDIIIPIFL